MINSSLIATLTTPPTTSGTELSALPDSVEWLEVRADLLGDLNPRLSSFIRGSRASLTLDISSRYFCCILAKSSNRY